MVTMYDIWVISIVEGIFLLGHRLKGFRILIYDIYQIKKNVICKNEDSFCYLNAHKKTQ